MSDAPSPETARLGIDIDLTIYNAASIKQSLIDAVSHHAAVQLDLSQVNEMDTSGFQLLVMAKREAQRLGRQFSIVAHSPAVQEVIEFYNMGAFFGDPVVIPAGQ